MHGYTTIRGTIIAEGDQAGAPPDDGPLYLKPEDGSPPLLLVDAIMAAQASIEYLAEQSRPSFLPALGQTVTMSGYCSGRVLYEASILETNDAPPAP